MAFIMVGKLAFDSKDLCKSLRHTVYGTYVCLLCMIYLSDTALRTKVERVIIAMMSGAT